MFETFDHTADLGLRIRSPNFDTLFVESATALFSIIVEDLSTVRPTVEVQVNLEAEERDYLLFDWLKELLYRFDGEHLLFSTFEVNVSEKGLLGKAWGEPMDRSRHELSHEVKAITYHAFKVEQTDEGWLAEIIVDI